MAFTPSSTIIPGPQSQPSLYDLTGFGVDLAVTQVQNNPGIYVNGSDQYIVLYNIPNHAGGVTTTNYTPRLSIRKRSGSSWNETAVFPIRNAIANSGGGLPLPNIFYTASCWDVAQIGDKLYCFFFPYVASPVLSLRIYDMSTDTLGGVISSSLPPSVFTTFNADPFNQFSGSSFNCAPGLSAFYSAITGLITIVDNNWTITGTDDGLYIRPAVARFNPAGNIFDPSWTQMGSDNTVLTHQGAFSACVDCRGAIDLVISEMSFAGSGLTSLFFQSFYADNSISALQNTGVSTSGFGVVQMDSRILCTGSVLLIPYGTGKSPAGYRTALFNARATVPAGNTLPVSWTPESVHAAVSNEGMTAYIGLLVGAQQIIVYFRHNEVTPSLSSLACAIWNGATWDDGAIPASTIELAIANNDGIIGFHSLITLDFTGTTVIGAGTNTEYVGNIQSLYSIASTTVPVCSLPLTIACPVGGGNAIVGVPYDSGPPVVTGGLAPFHFTLAGGSIPPGMTLNPNTGAVTGTTFVAGTYSYTLEVTDSSSPPLSAMVTEPCSILVTGGAATLPCANITPHPSTDVQWKLIKVMVTMKPAVHLPVRGSVK